MTRIELNIGFIGNPIEYESSGADPYRLACRSRQLYMPKLAKGYVCPTLGGNRKQSAMKGKKTRHTQGLRKHRSSVVYESSELWDSPPIKNFDNEISKVNYKNI